MKYDLEKLDSIDSANPDEVKELQKFLKERGFYVGPKTDIDGNWGGKTIEGVSKLREELKETAKISRDTAVANQQANDPTNNAIRGATELAPYGVGVGTGLVGGHLIARAMTNAWDRDKAATKQLANTPGISGAVAETKLGGMRTARNTITGAQFLGPAALLGSAEYMRSHVAPNFEGETKKWMDLGANAEQGAGLGLAAHQLLDLRNRIASPADAVDEALIETRAAAERNPAAPPPPATRPNGERLIAAAKAAGATGKLTKTTAAEYLAKNVTEANRAAVAAELGVTKGQQVAATVKKLLAKPGASSIVGPLIAGGVAYDAASNDAEAAGATPGEARTKGAVAGTGAAGLAAGAGYGLNKLAQYAPNLSRMLGIGAGTMTMPQLAMDMGPKDSLEHQKERTAIAQKYPRLAKFFGIEDEMAQLPERNMGKADEFATSRSLQIPEGIPAPNPDGSSAYPDLTAAMMRNAPAAARPPSPVSFQTRRLISAMQGQR